MSGGGTKLLAGTLLYLNLLPGSLSAQFAAAAAPPAPAAQTSMSSRYSAKADGGQEPTPPSDTPPKPAPAQSDAEGITVTEDTAVDQQMARRRVNETLRELAMDDFKRTSKLAKDGYSKDLDKKQSSLSKYLHKNNPALTKAVIIDPIKFDTALALGMEPELATQTVLGLQKVSPSDELVTNITRHMKSNDASTYAAQDSFTQDASAHWDFFNKSPQACVIVPEPGDDLAAYVPGLSYQENLDYANLHEGWHCKNTMIDYSSVPKEAYDSANPYAPDKSINSEDQLKVFSITDHGESLSDVGAVGDMIRKGHGLDVLDKVQAWRYDNAEDYGHWTGASLEGLKQKINEMGIDKFRHLNDKDARKLYETVVNENAYTPREAEVIFQYRRVSDDEERAQLVDWKTNFGTLESLMHAGAAIHDGADMKTLDDAIAKAENDQTKGALSSLRDQINAMGVEKFRALSADNAVKLADNLKASGFVPSDIGTDAAAYWISPADGRTSMEKMIGEYKTAIPKALEMMNPYGPAPTEDEKKALTQAAFDIAHPQANPVKPPLSPEEQAVFTQLSTWDAAQMLQDRAFAKDGKITPGTLIKAYGKMQEELRAQLQQNPEDPLLHAKEGKLQQSFITTVRDLDYVDVNAKRGVDILEKEPALKAALKKLPPLKPTILVHGPDGLVLKRTPPAPGPGA
jgi:hypothetical protein